MTRNELHQQRGRASAGAVGGADGSASLLTEDAMARVNAETGESLDLYTQRVYDAIPKSVFAAIAWHLANLCTHADAAATGSRILEEWDALILNGIVPQRPSRELRELLTARRGGI